ncbi:SPOR domain-containing protein [Bosea sp. BIWAKO-01]|uniref:SPOR domain-containing protein n=1 Tax=Bosea sp. BIWAKO-01 TaxID=506668 RepID=UPI00086CDC7C|nr:SPOR domain-containing protein [Bosea sp. BIWAKO-01]GAU84374.1 sporulation domain protein [Bosea sp. BIWAKO-01]
MSEPARNRFALDLDDLERQLRGAAQPPKAGASVDPLVELTRIVGQDDPLKELFSPRAAAAPVQQQAAAAAAWPGARQRQEPSFAQAPAQQPAAANNAQPPAEMLGALDEFEALLRRGDIARPAPAAEPVRQAAVYVPTPVEQPEPYRAARSEPARPAAHDARDLDEERANAQYQDYGHDTQADYPEPPLMAEDDYQDLPPRRSRKGLWAAAAAIAVAVIGVGGYMGLRGSSVTSDGQPPVIAADGGPSKVAPTNPGGAEIPNQNKQIYERAGDSPSNPTKVVSREEQPVDIQQAARTMPGRMVMPGLGSTPQAGANGNPLAQAPAAPERGSVSPAEAGLIATSSVPGLGEPRRVRTVSIRPDGTPAPPPGASAAYSNGAAGVATGAAPTRLGGNLPLNPSSTASTNPPRQRTAATPAVAPEAPKAQERVATPAPATTPAAPMRVASAAPTPAPAATPAPATAAIRSGTGDFAVQLAAPGSEAEARAAFAALQRKYPGQLGGQSPIVKKTDLAGGKTVYRLRIGPYSREDAATMCTQLQAAGGQCFIAKN